MEKTEEEEGGSEMNIGLLIATVLSFLLFLGNLILAIITLIWDESFLLGFSATLISLGFLLLFIAGIKILREAK